MERIATAIALILVVAGTAGALAGAPVAAQDASAAPHASEDCPLVPDFVIAESHTLATSRLLIPGQEDIGLANVEAGTPEDLMVHLETSDANLDIEVFFLDSRGDCAEYNASACDQEQDTASQHEVICELDAPEDRNYWVHFTNVGAEALLYHTWTPTA